MVMLCKVSATAVNKVGSPMHAAVAAMWVVIKVVAFDTTPKPYGGRGGYLIISRSIFWSF
jgi:hypothetical protein